MNNKILITGSRGFIGSHLMKVFPRAQSYDLKDVQDILDINLLKDALEGKEIVIHLAALISITGSIQNPGKYYSANVAGTDNVLRAAIEAGCKTVIFASSASVYSPDNPYAVSKKIGEDLMKEYSKKIQTISLRFFNIYGPGQNPEYAGVISKFMRAAKEGKTLKINGDGRQTRDFISVNDVTGIIEKVIRCRSKIASGSIFDVGTGKEISINQLADYFVKKYKVPVKYYLKEDAGIIRSKADNLKLLEIVGKHKFASIVRGLSELDDKKIS